MHRQHARSLSALSHHRMRPGCASPRPSPPSPSPLAKISPRSVKKTPPAPNSSMKAGGTRHRPRHGHGRDAPPCSGRRHGRQFPVSAAGAQEKNFSRSVKKTPPAPNTSMKAGGTRHRPRHGHGRDAPPASAADTAGSSLPQRLEPRKKENFPRSVKKTLTAPNSSMKAGGTRRDPRPQAPSFPGPTCTGPAPGATPHHPLTQECSWNESQSSLIWPTSRPPPPDVWITRPCTAISAKAVTCRKPTPMCRWIPASPGT